MQIILSLLIVLIASSTHGLLKIICRTDLKNRQRDGILANAALALFAIVVVAAAAAFSCEVATYRNVIEIDGITRNE